MPDVGGVVGSVVGSVVGGVVGVVPPPTWTSCHCWLAPPQSSYWTMFAPSAVDAPWTSTALPLLRLTSVT